MLVLFSIIFTNRNIFPWHLWKRPMFTQQCSISPLFRMISTWSQTCRTARQQRLATGNGNNFWTVSVDFPGRVCKFSQRFCLLNSYIKRVFLHKPWGKLCLWFTSECKEGESAASKLSVCFLYQERGDPRNKFWLLFRTKGMSSPHSSSSGTHSILRLSSLAC